MVQFRRSLIANTVNRCIQYRSISSVLQSVHRSNWIQFGYLIFVFKTNNIIKEIFQEISTTKVLTHMCIFHLHPVCLFLLWWTYCSEICNNDLNKFWKWNDLITNSSLLKFTISFFNSNQGCQNNAYYISFILSDILVSIFFSNVIIKYVIIKYLKLFFCW